MDMKKRNRVRLIGELFLLIVIWGASTGCTEETVQPEPGTDNRKVVNINCCLQVDPLVGEPATRADGAMLGGEGTTEAEAEVKDLTVIQFDGDGTDANVPMVVVRTFKNPRLNELVIGLMQSPSQAIQFLYFISNVGDVLANFTGTLADLEGKLLSISREGSLSEGIVMTGTARTNVVTGPTLAVKLTRRFAKIRFTYNTDKLPNGDTFEPVWLQLLSVPQAMTLGSTSETTDTSVGFSDLYPVLKDIKKGYVWYIPENKRGTGNNTTGQVTGKIAANAPDSYCTYILLEGNYTTKEGDSRKVYYRFYPGDDATNDFNLKGNYVYNVELNLTGMNTGDGRVTSSTMESLPGANCYMTAPGSTLTFNPYEAAGVYVASTNWKSYADRMGTKENGKIDHVGLVWQTEPGLVKNIYNLTSSGEIRLTTDNKLGNALVAAYDVNNKILWSWHIWITDYSVKKVDYSTMTETSATVDHGSVYKFKDYIWMDRGPGALSNERTNITNLGMTYQWGRKDPFVPANSFTASTLTPMYDANGERIEATGKQFDQAYINTVGDMFDNVMQNPLTFFTNGGDLWYGFSAKGDLWSSSAKTFFDPCPAGWCVPPASARPGSGDVYYYYKAGAAGNGFYIKGMEGLFWPYVGYRNVSTGSLNGNGSQGIYWTSDNGSKRGNSWAKIYGAGGTAWDSNFDLSRRHSDGMTARCVKIK